MIVPILPLVTSVPYVRSIRLSLQERNERSEGVTDVDEWSVGKGRVG